MGKLFRVKTIWLMVLLLGLLSAVGTRAQEATPEATPDTAFAARTYELHVPNSYQEGQAVPLLMVLHGASGSGKRSETVLGFDDLADKDGFIVVYPNGIYHNWDFGVGMSTPDGSGMRVDDVGYLVWLVEQLEQEYSIDPARVFVTGNSNGALMAYRLACEARDTFQAVAGVAAGIFTPAVQNCEDRPISVLTIQGTEDRILPWDGTDLNGQHVGLSAAESLTFWTRLNHCDTAKDSVKAESLPDTDTSDHSTVTRIPITDCANGTQVLFYAIVGGGHTWPGHPFDPGFDIGATNLDIDATQVIWDWFASLDTAVPESTPTG